MSGKLGKPVEIRHGPATVSAESLGDQGHWVQDSREDSLGSAMRESGDRPVARMGSDRFRWESR